MLEQIISFHFYNYMRSAVKKDYDR